MKVPPPPVTACCTAEFAGTFLVAFTFFSGAHSESIGLAISVGAALAAAIYAFGGISGGHVNPAVTLAVLLSGRNKIEGHVALSYCCSQFLGGVSAALLYAWSNPGKAGSVSLPASHDAALATEVLYTAALCYVFLNVATCTRGQDRIVSANAVFGLAPGLTVMAAMIAAAPLTGGTLNPALSLGTALLTHLRHTALPLSRWAGLLLAPAAGASVGAALFFAARGGLTGRDEYAEGRSVVPPLPHSATPERTPRSIPLRRRNPVLLPEDVVNHDLSCCLEWDMLPRDTGTVPPCEIDLTIAKFSTSGESLGAVYFASKDTHGMHHQGTVGSPDADKGAESIALRLADTKSNIAALMVVGIVYTAGTWFDDVARYSLSIRDLTDGSREFCRYEERDTKPGSNALVAAIFYRRQGRWYFEAIDEYYTVPPLSSYRKMLPQLKQLFGTVVAPELNAASRV